MMDKLNLLWETQLSFNDQFFQKKVGKNTNELTLEEKVHWTKNQLLSIVKETMEVLDEVPNWKEHRVGNGDFIPSNLWEEIIDVNKFSVGLAQIWGMSKNQFFDEYMRKSMVVQQRWEQEHGFTNIKEDSKIVGIDIDGVLGHYPDWFFEFAYEECDEGIFHSIEEMKNKLGIERYEEVKHAYRQSGWKASMPAFEDASDFTHKLKEQGYSIVILTARPYQEYSRIYPDTLQFLNRNKIVFDAIIWDKNKHLKIIKEFPNIEFMVEDDVDNAIAIAEQHIPVFLKVNKYNKQRAEGVKNRCIIKIDSLSDIIERYL